MKSIALGIIALILALASSAASQSDCVCPRTDKLTQPTPGGTCNGGADCYDFSLENNVPIPEGEEDGRCQTAEPCTADPRTCKFPSYGLRVTSSGCAAACAGGYSTLKVTYTTPAGATGSGTMSAQNGSYPPPGDPAIPFSVADMDCGDSPITANITVEAGGIVYEVQRKSACSQCKKITDP
jgi:hypothetical protein